MSQETLRSLTTLDAATAARIEGIFCDIDDTLTWEGRLIPEAFQALVDAKSAGLRVIPITGRPGGWVDQIARMWPVDGVVGENGGLWFYRRDSHMERRFLQSAAERADNRRKLDRLAQQILREVPGTGLASDQTYRDLDLAIDFCEDVPRLSDAAIDRIVELFHEAGATCKVSSIHVNGWFGAFDKLKGCRRILDDLFEESLEQATSTWMFVGDSANDEPMFRAFDVSVGVANVREFLPRMSHHPTYITTARGGWGFAEAVSRLLALRRT